MPRAGSAEALTPFVRECRRILTARLDAKTTAEKDDAEWAWQYLFQMNKADRLDEYFASKR